MIRYSLTAGRIIRPIQPHRANCSARLRQNIASYRICASGSEKRRPSLATRMRSQVKTAKSGIGHDAWHLPDLRWREGQESPGNSRQKFSAWLPELACSFDHLLSSVARGITHL